jgi:PAS domain S-box-containing protein
MLSDSSVLDAEGDILGEATVVRDVSERRATQGELAASRQRAQDILESISDAFYALDHDWRLTYLNARTEQLWGRPREALLGQVLWDIFPQVRGTETHTQHLRAAHERRRVTYETVSPILGQWIEVTIYPSEAGLSVYFHDITPRKQAEAAERAARETAERMAAHAAVLSDASRVLAEVGPELAAVRSAIARIVADKVGDGCLVFLLSSEGHMVEPLVGYHANPETLAVMLAVVAGWPKRAGRHPSPVYRVLRSGRPVLEPSIGPEQARAETLPEHWWFVERLGMHSRAAVPLCVQGRISGVLLAWRQSSEHSYTQHDLRLLEDISERAGLAIDNARLFEQARDAIRLREEVLTAVSHDLKAPLTSIQGTAQMVERTFQLESEASQQHLTSSMRRICDATTRMATWIDELVDVARLHAGQHLTLRRVPTDLVRLVREAVAELHASAPDRAVRLELPDAQLVGDWDAARLRRVLDNLLSNAVKYSPDGGEIVVTVGREAGARGMAAVVKVSDPGVGIPATDLPYIFERFHRARNVLGRFGGTGIGLAGARQIVQEHGGRIEVQSEEGRGTTFTVHLLTQASAGMEGAAG